MPFKKLLVISLLIVSVHVHTPEQLVTHFSNEELKCLLKNIYHEARGEPLAGQVAVARVTLNRAAKSSICKVVYAPKQFSWTHMKVKHPKTYSYQLYEAAHLALKSDFTATHYHATYVNPKWSTKLTKLGQIGNHVFYK